MQTREVRRREPLLLPKRCPRSPLATNRTFLPADRRLTAPRFHERPALLILRGGNTTHSTLPAAEERDPRRPSRGLQIPPVVTPANTSDPYAPPTRFATQDADAEPADMMEEKVTNTDPGAGHETTIMEAVEVPAAAAELPGNVQLQPDTADATQDMAETASEGANDPPPPNGVQEAGQPDAPGDTRTRALEENQMHDPDVSRPEEPALPAESAVGEQHQQPAEPLHASEARIEETPSGVHAANAADPFTSEQRALGSAVEAGGMLPNGLNRQADVYEGMDVQPSDALGISPDILTAIRRDSPTSALQAEETRQCAFAKLEFPDGDFYMTTYAVELGRDARAFRQEMRRRNREELQEQQRPGSVGDGPQTPLRPTAPSVASVCRSNLSECGGIMGGEDYHVSVAPLKRKRKKKDSKSTSSSSQRHSRKSSITGSHPFEPVDYNGLAMHSQPDTSSFLPDPYEIPLVPIHPPMSADGDPVGHKGISRKHLKIYYSFDNQGFEMKVLGRNGAFLNDTHYVPTDDPVELHDGDKIQIGAVSIMFRLPNAPADGDVRSDSSDSISGGISLNFEDGRGQSIVADEESEDDGYSYNDQYDFSPHAYGWASEEEELSGDDDVEDDYHEEPAPTFKLKLKLKQSAPKQSAKESRAETRVKKKKKKEKLKSKHESKASGKTAPKPQPKAQPEETSKEKEKETQKERKAAAKTATKAASKGPPKTVDKSKEKPKDEPTSQVNIVPPEDVPHPSTETPQIKTEGDKEKEKEKPSESQPNKDSSGRRVLTAEEAERLGLEPGTVIERKKGPGRPPKDGIMSKREKAEIMRRKKEAEKARKLGLDPESITKVDLSKPRKDTKEGEGKPGADKKPRGSEGAEGESVPADGEQQSADKKPVKLSRPLRSPSPEMKESDYTEEQLQRPAANYVVLIHEAISNSKDGKLNLQQIYSAIERKYPYYKFKTGTTGWQSSVRHNLGQHDAFRKAEKEGKGWMWAINPGVSIEKERRKRVTPPPQPQPRPYYPPSHQSPYGMMPHGIPNYSHPPGPYPPRPPAAPGAPGHPATQQRTYQSPYGSQPLGQAVQPVQQQHRTPYPPNGARPPYYGTSPYGPPPGAPPMSYPPASGSSSQPPAAGSSYVTAGPSPYAPASGAPSYAPTTTAPVHPSRPSHTPQPQIGQPSSSQSIQQPGQASSTRPPHSAGPPPNPHSSEPIPSRTPNLYADSAPYASILNSFRDYYIKNAHAMLQRSLTRDQIVKLTDRGLERALHPERYQNRQEQDLSEGEKLDLKDEKDIEEAVKGMLKKFNYGYIVEEAEKRVGKAPAQGASSTPPQAVAPPQLGPVAGQAATPGQAPPPGQVPVQTQAPGQASARPQAQGQSQPAAPFQSQASTSTAGQALVSAPAQDASTQSAERPMSSSPSNTPIAPYAAPASSGPMHPAAQQVPRPLQPDVKPHAPTQAQAPPPRTNGTGTPVPPPVEALTPLGGSPKPATPTAVRAPSPGPATAAASGMTSGKRPSPAAGVKRGFEGAANGQSEAKKAKVEAQ